MYMRILSLLAIGVVFSCYCRTTTVIGGKWDANSAVFSARFSLAQKTTIQMLWMAKWASAADKRAQENWNQDQHNKRTAATISIRVNERKYGLTCKRTKQKKKQLKNENKIKKRDVVVTDESRTISLCACVRAWVRVNFIHNIILYYVTSRNKEREKGREINIYECMWYANVHSFSNTISNNVNILTKNICIIVCVAVCLYTRYIHI